MSNSVYGVIITTGPSAEASMDPSNEYTNVDDIYIKWSTDESSSSVVHYKIGSGSWQIKSGESGKEHNVNIGKFNAYSTIYYKAYSKVNENNSIWSSEKSIYINLAVPHLFLDRSRITESVTLRCSDYSTKSGYTIISNNGKGSASGITCSVSDVSGLTSWLTFDCSSSISGKGTGSINYNMRVPYGINIKEGTYQAKVYVSHGGATIGTVTISLMVRWPPPTLVLNPYSINFGKVKCDTIQPKQSVKMYESGCYYDLESLRYSLDSGVTLYSKPYKIPKGSSDTLGVTFTTAHYEEPGNYTKKVDITSEGFHKGTLSIYYSIPYPIMELVGNEWDMGTITIASDKKLLSNNIKIKEKNGYTPLRNIKFESELIDAPGVPKSGTWIKAKEYIKNLPPSIYEIDKGRLKEQNISLEVPNTATLGSYGYRIHIDAGNDKDGEKNYTIKFMLSIEPPECSKLKSRSNDARIRSMADNCIKMINKLEDSSVLMEKSGRDVSAFLWNMYHLADKIIEGPDSSNYLEIKNYVKNIKTNYDGINSVYSRLKNVPELSSMVSSIKGTSTSVFDDTTQKYLDKLKNKNCECIYDDIKRHETILEIYNVKKDYYMAGEERETIGKLNSEREEVLNEADDLVTDAGETVEKFKDENSAWFLFSISEQYNGAKEKYSQAASNYKKAGFSTPQELDTRINDINNKQEILESIYISKRNNFFVISTIFIIICSFIVVDLIKTKIAINKEEELKNSFKSFGNIR